MSAPRDMLLRAPIRAAYADESDDDTVYATVMSLSVRR